MSNTTDTQKADAGDEDWKYVVLSQRGETDAFDVLVERHQQKMLNIAYRMTGDYNEACDITQDAFIAAYKSIRKFKGDARFSTWLYRIVINFSKNRLKHLHGKERRESFSLDDLGGMQKRGTVEQSLTDEFNPSMEMEKRERETQVQKCISALDEEYREVLVLRDIQGFSYDEIKAILGLPDGTVKSRLSRARNALKDCLKKVMGDL